MSLTFAENRTLLDKVRHAYRRIVPETLRRSLSPAAFAIDQLINPKTRGCENWKRDIYNPFLDGEKEYMFLSIATFCHGNRPTEGYYMEFGCHSGGTMSLAWKHTAHLFDWTYAAFDSFEGLPEITEIDRQEIWKKGKLKTGEEEFVSTVTGAGLPRDRLITVKGFYQDSLTPELQKRLLPKKAAVLYVDCDLYESTVPVLDFVRPFLQRGTIIVFDDWFCFHGDPERGEQRAWNEFLAQYPTLRFVPFVTTSKSAAFIYVGDKSDPANG